MNSPAGEESQWWGRAVPGTLIFVGGEGERCLAGSSLWRWHRGDSAWARSCGVWRQGGAWVCGEREDESARVSRREGTTDKQNWARRAMGG